MTKEHKDNTHTGRTLRSRTSVDKSRGPSAVAKYVERHDTYAAASQTSPNKVLTHKQKAFVKFWAQGESPKAAAEKAGYSSNCSHTYAMTRMPAIRKIYEEEKRLYAESCQMTRKRVMDGLLEAVEMAKIMNEPASMVSGWREIGKMCGYYEPIRKKVEVNISGSVIAERMNRLSDAELMKIIQQGVVDSDADDDRDDESDQLLLD